MPDFLRTPVAFVIVLGVLVFIHELGHYLAARWVGVHVETFSIGFGRAIASWTDRRGTLWKVAWIPLGGFVKLHGQERPEDVSAEERALWQPGRTFHEKTVGARALVVAAGPAANFLLAAVLFAFLFAATGRPVNVPVVGEVVAGSAAARAGLQVGDRIEAIDGAAITRFEQIQQIVAASPGRQLRLDVASGGASHDVLLTPDTREAGGRQVGVLGIRANAVEYEQLSLLEAVPAGIVQTWDVTAQTLAGVWQMISQNRGTEDLGGPLRIAQLSGQVAQLGLASLVSFIAVLSVNLGLINLFPIPVLDGGHLLFYLAEAVRGRPLPPRAQEYGFRAGLALILGLFVFATWNDLTHIGLFRWVAGVLG
ncbi:RIP metalloprotease RseP [Rhodovastum atsumiense]|uniref:Zinc metalloprotease n=1 Tax=Rhodovastum atsumiense TaxID=504468 RepID=A0A5M6J0W0_9PROT|nr:RIP metalloprotease RseP [Rhodovastum atsumiense]